MKFYNGSQLTFHSLHWGFIVSGVINHCFGNLCTTNRSLTLWKWGHKFGWNWVHTATVLSPQIVLETVSASLALVACSSSNIIISSRSRISHRGADLVGGANSQGDYVSKNCVCQNERIWTHGGHVPVVPPWIHHWLWLTCNNHYLYPDFRCKGPSSSKLLSNLVYRCIFPPKVVILNYFALYLWGQVVTFGGKMCLHGGKYDLSTWIINEWQIGCTAVSFHFVNGWGSKAKPCK